jgi:hypothetical protein
LKDFEKKLEKYKKDWQYLCEQKEWVKWNKEEW